MKIIKKVNVYPEIDNDIRQEVYKWCEKTFGPKGWITEDEWIWFSNSNYKFRILYKYLIGQTQESILEYDLL